MPKMPSVRFQRTPRHVSLLTATFVEKRGIVSDSLTGIHTAIVTCLFVANRSCIQTGFQVSPQVKIKRIVIRRRA
jgi:hypothetical protein